MLRRFSFLALMIALTMVFSGLAMAVAPSATETYNVTLTVDPAIEAHSIIALTVPSTIPNVPSSVVNSAGYFKSNGPTAFTYAATALQRAETGIDAGSGVIDYVKTDYEVKLNSGVGLITNLNLTGIQDLDDGPSPKVTSYNGNGANITVNPHGGQIGIQVTVAAAPVWTDDSGIYTGALTITATVSSY